MGRRVYVGALVLSIMGWMALLMVILGWQNPSAPGPAPELDPALQAYLGHLSLFGVLGMLVSHTFGYMKGREQIWLGVAAALLTGLIWGIVTEWYQLYVPGREASFVDVLTDLIGAGLGGVLVGALYRLIRLPAYRV